MEMNRNPRVILEVHRRLFLTRENIHFFDYSVELDAWPGIVGLETAPLRPGTFDLISADARAEWPVAAARDQKRRTGQADHAVAAIGVRHVARVTPGHAGPSELGGGV